MHSPSACVIGGAVYETRGCGQRATYMCNEGSEEITYRPRCILESRDGYASRAEHTAPSKPQPRQSMPGW